MFVGKKLSAPMSEEEIVKHWKYTDKIYVSIVCTTFNQEGYIRDAIESFLAQKTQYKFEIIIHDDASTDNTATIVKEYADKYPTIIKAVLQKENQYSKGERVSALAIGYSKGEFVAFCEGDDYWSSNKKLEYQYEKLKSHPECDLSFHSCHYLYDESKMKLMNQYETKITFINVNQVIAEGGGYMPTPSLMIKKEVIDNMPDWFHSAPFGDYYYQIFGSIRGGALYLPEPMCVYRRFSQGSWSSQYHMQCVHKKIAVIRKLHNSLDQLKNDISVDCTPSINNFKSRSYYNIAKIALKEKEYRIFQENIKESWAFNQCINSGQVIMFYFKMLPSFVLALITIKDSIKDKKAGLLFL